MSCRRATSVTVVSAWSPDPAPPPVAMPPATLETLDTGDAHVAAILRRVAKLHGRDIPILVLGKTGTGKEWLARAIHHDSPRRAAPFVALNCASLPDTLIEAELFGYEDGAFTGAKKRGSVAGSISSKPCRNKERACTSAPASRSCRTTSRKRASTS